MASDTENETPKGSGADESAGTPGTDHPDIPPWLQAVPQEEEKGRGAMFYILAGGAVTLVLLFVVAIVYFYTQNRDEAPLYVEAPSEPVRTKPDDAGGLEVPHQDKAIYDQGAGKSPNSDAVLAETAEAPVDVETAIADQKESSVAEEPKAMDSAGAPASTTMSQPEESAQAPAPAPEMAAQARGFMVQLGAYGSEKGARNFWNVLKGKFPDELGAFDAVLEPVQSGGRTLYRLRTGGFEKRADADLLCAKLKAKDQVCIVVSP